MYEKTRAAFIWGGVFKYKTKTRHMKEKLINWTLLELKTSVLQKTEENIKKMKRKLREHEEELQTGRKYLAVHI